VFVEKRSEFHSYNRANAQSGVIPSGFTNNPYFPSSFTSSFLVENTGSYHSAEKVDVSRQLEKDKNYGRDPEEHYRLIEEERWKGDYEGHVRKTPRNLGDLPIY